MARLLMLALVAGLATAPTASAQQTSTLSALTPADNIAIEQLEARYAFAIDACTNGGADFAVPKTQGGYGISHIVANHVIMPSPEGATGKSYLLAIGVGGDPTIERQGGYEDVYVRIPAGWRFTSRVHVFPNLCESVQFGSGGRR
jgi:hypothetical protein